ncbi:hypothetical protein GA0115280_10416 [Streptomyces sp. Cmuel-A718b]|nr:hypothetical protein GA0115280_10416 [Streptomyces sp. Cmuel-A718b]
MGQFGSGGGEEFADGPGLDDPAALHERSGVADGLDDVHLVGDEQDGEAELLVEVAQQLEDGAGGLGVERGGRLVGEQHLGVAREGAGYAHALLLAAGELSGVGLRLVGQADQVQQLLGLAGAGLAGDAEDLQRQFDVVQDGAGVQQVEVLEDHADAGACPAQLGARPPAAAGEGGEVLAGHCHGAGGGAFQEVDAADEGGLAGAALSDDAVDLAFADVQVDAVECGDLTVARLVDLREARRGDHRGFPSLSSARRGVRRARGIRRGDCSGWWAGSCLGMASSGDRPGGSACAGGLVPGTANGTGSGLASGREAQAGALRRRAFDTYNEHRAC